MTEIITAYRCLECDEVSDEAAEGALYECSRCGDTFTREGSADGESNRCMTCNIFGAKVAELGCAHCNAGEVEEVQAVEIDGELIVVEGDLSPEELVAQAEERHEAALAKEHESEALKAAEKAKRAARFDGKPRVQVKDVLPGDLLGYHDPRSTRDEYPEYRVGRVYDKGDGRIGLDPPGGMGLCFVSDPDDVFVLLERPEVTPENEASLAEKLAASGLDRTISYTPEEKN